MWSANLPSNHVKKDVTLPNRLSEENRWFFPSWLLEWPTVCVNETVIEIMKDIFTNRCHVLRGDGIGGILNKGAAFLYKQLSIMI